MHHYPHHIGDFNNATRHLSRIERSIYREMLDLYYAKEQALPANEAVLFRLLIIRDPDEVAAARQVLEEFFELTEVGWVNGRCDREIDVYHQGAERSARGGRAKAWKAVDKAIRAHVRAKDAFQARGLLLDFVNRHGHDEATRDVEEMIANLEQQPAGQGALDLVAQAALAAALEAVQAKPAVHGTQRQPQQAGRLPDVCEHDAGTLRAGCEHTASTLRASANQNQNQNHNQNQNQNHPSQPPTLSEEPRASAVELSIACRKAGVMSQPADPRLIKLASQGVSVDTIVAACDAAKSAKRDGPPNLGYVVKVLETWAKGANAMRATGAVQPGLQGPRSANNKAHEWAASLTGRNRNDQRNAPEFIDLNPAPDLG